MNDESSVSPSPMSTMGSWLGLAFNGGAVLVGATIDSTSWPIQIVTVSIGVAVGCVLGSKADLWQALKALVIVLAIAAAMVTGAITPWLGFVAFMSVATGSSVRQIVSTRSSA